LKTENGSIDDPQPSIELGRRDVFCNIDCLAFIARTKYLGKTSGNQNQSMQHHT